MEMQDTQIGRRLISGHAKIQTSALKKGKILESDYPRFLEAIEYLAALPITISDATGWTTTSMRADLARQKSQNGVEWYVVDYLHLLDDALHLSDTERTGRISRGLKGTSQSLNLAGIIINSMTKEGMNSAGIAPSQTGMRGSGQVLHDADLITFLTKYPDNNLPGDMVSAKDRENLRVLWFAKGRELESDRKWITLVKQPGFPSFGEYRGML